MKTPKSQDREKLRRKIREAVREARERGFVGGAPRKLDYLTIQTLRADGLTLREIALKLGCSVGGIQYALKVLEGEIPC